MDGIPADTLYEEFIDYQCMNDADIGDEAWEEVKASDGVKNDINNENNSYHYRFDILWRHIAQLCIPGCSVKRFILNKTCFILKCLLCLIVMQS